MLLETHLQKLLVSFSQDKAMLLGKDKWLIIAYLRLHLKATDVQKDQQHCKKLSPKEDTLL